MAKEFSITNTQPAAVTLHTTPFRFIWKAPSFRQWDLNPSTSLPGGSFQVGDNVLIGGFIITGTEPKIVVLRALGPSLSGFGLSGVLSDPVLSLYNSSGTLIATNDNWQSDPQTPTILEANGLAPANLLESATVQTLPPGAYTVIVSGKDLDPGDWLGGALRSLAAIQL